MMNSCHFRLLTRLRYLQKQQKATANSRWERMVQRKLMLSESEQQEQRQQQGMGSAAQIRVVGMPYRYACSCTRMSLLSKNGSQGLKATDSFRSSKQPLTGRDTS